MMVTVLRSVGGIAAGIGVAFILIIAVELFSEVVHPFPDDLEGTHEEVCQHVERCPPWVLAVAVPMWGFAAFAGVWTAGRLGNRSSSLILGLLLLAAVILNIAQLPYPVWFEVASPIAIVAGIAFGYRRSTRRAVTVASSAG